MSFRRCLHLFAWMSVATHFLVGTHAALALSAWLDRPVDAAAPTVKRSCCQHCQSRNSQPPPTKESRDKPTRPFDPKPCHDCESCVFCAVAGLAAMPPAQTPSVVPSFLSEGWRDPFQVHFSSSVGGLMRPPRPECIATA